MYETVDKDGTERLSTPEGVEKELEIPITFYKRVEKNKNEFLSLSSSILLSVSSGGQKADEDKPSYTRE